MPKAKRVNKDKDQLVREREVARKREIVVEKFYPALIKATVSVDESKALIQAMSTLLMEEVLKTMKERKFSEIVDSMVDKLCTDGERKTEIQDLLATVKDENLYVAREIIEGMTRAIETMIIEEMRERPLSTLKPDWQKYLN